MASCKTPLGEKLESAVKKSAAESRRESHQAMPVDGLVGAGADDDDDDEPSYPLWAANSRCASSKSFHTDRTATPSPHAWQTILYSGMMSAKKPKPQMR